MPEPFAGYEIGKQYHLHRDMWKDSPGFGVYIGGIAPKGRYPRTEAVAILATIGENTRYGNRWDGDVLVFSGEDRRSVPGAREVDQSSEMGGNRVLTHSKELGIPIYCFWARVAEQNWTYLGLGEVDSWALEPRAGRKVVEYRISLLNAPNVEVLRALRESLKREITSAGPPTLTTPGGRPRKESTRRVRSQVFAEVVKISYSNRCGICGISRKDARGSFEVEAAHIYPVEKDGSDDARNGMALCRLHHWAFDGALLGIDTDLIVHVLGPGKGVEGVKEFDGRPLAVLPDSPDLRPHALFLEHRMRLSKSGWTRGGEGQSG